MPSTSDHIDFEHYIGKKIRSIEYEQFDEWGSIAICFDDGEVLEIYAEELDFEHITTEGEDSGML